MGIRSTVEGTLLTARHERDERQSSPRSAHLLAVEVPPLWVFTRRAFGGGEEATAAAYLVAVAYAERGA